MFIDTHCHLYNEYYDDLQKILDNAKNNKITIVINSGCDSKSNKEVIEKIAKYNNMYGTIGIHPEEALHYKKEDIEYIKTNLNNKKIIAIGEIGLDYHYTKDNKKEQIQLFEKQLKLAEKYNLPVVIHSREATSDTINILKKYKLKGVIHAFSGSLETANIYIKMGFLIGVGGVLTFKNSNLKNVIEKIPLNKIVLETDSPYLSPAPLRGTTNEPSNIYFVAEFLANLKQISIADLANITTKNAKEIFDIP